MVVRISTLNLYDPYLSIGITRAVKQAVKMNMKIAALMMATAVILIHTKAESEFTELAVTIVTVMLTSMSMITVLI